MSTWELFTTQFIDKGGYKTVLSGLLTTVEVAVIGLVIGIVLGTLIAVVRVMPKYKTLPKMLNGICDVYVGFFRGTPMVVQLLIGWFVVANAWNSFCTNSGNYSIMLDKLVVAILVYGLNSAAYVSEIMRSGIQSVDRGQLEAGRALGLPYRTAMLKIVIPQSIKNILPTLGNEFITLVKDTSILSFVAIVDVTKAFRQIGDANYSYVVPYLMLAAVYLVLVMLISLGIKAMEKRFKRSER